MKQRSRLLRWMVLAVYTVASVTVGLFHDLHAHGGSGYCACNAHATQSCDAEQGCTDECCSHADGRSDKTRCCGDQCHGSSRCDGHHGCKEHADCHEHQHHEHCPSHARCDTAGSQRNCVQTPAQDTEPDADHDDEHDEQPGRPGHCDGCAACQFLAAVPLLLEAPRLEAAEFVVPLTPPPLLMADGVETPRLHWARGPPQQA